MKRLAHHMLLLLALLHGAVLNTSTVHAHAEHAHGPGDCGNPDPSQDDEARAIANEIKTFGKPGNQLSRSELSGIVQSAKNKGKTPPPFSLRNRNLQEIDPSYILVDIPLVYHVLTGQYKPDSSAGPVTATAAQLEFMTAKTNELYNIYDKPTQTSVQWASFNNTETIYHTDVIEADCSSLTAANYDSIIKDVDEWQFKMHVIICESTSWSGTASFPNSYTVTNVRHNMFRVEFRAVACYDEDGNFLCDLTGEEQVSHTRWWRTRSTVTAHELG